MIKDQIMFRNVDICLQKCPAVRKCVDWFSAAEYKGLEMSVTAYLCGVSFLYKLKKISFWVVEKQRLTEGVRGRQQMHYEKHQLWWTQWPSVSPQPNNSPALKQISDISEVFCKLKDHKLGQIRVLLFLPVGFWKLALLSSLLCPFSRNSGIFTEHPLKGFD